MKSPKQFLTHVQPASTLITLQEEETNVLVAIAALKDALAAMEHAQPRRGFGCDDYTSFEATEVAPLRPKG